MSYEDSDEIIDAEIAINLAAVWACRIEDGLVRVYLNDDEYLTFEQSAVEALVKVLVPFVKEAPCTATSN